MKKIRCFAVITALVAYSATFSQNQAGFDSFILNENSYWIGSTQGSNDFQSEFALNLDNYSKNLLLVLW